MVRVSQTTFLAARIRFVGHEPRLYYGEFSKHHGDLQKHRNEFSKHYSDF